MADCDEALRELYNYLHNELSDEDRAFITEHLDDCPDCGRAYTFQEQFKVVVARGCQEIPPAELRERIRSMLREPSLWPDDWAR